MPSDWESVYAAAYRRLVAQVAAVCGSRVEAEEAVQEAFVRALGLSGHRAVVDEPEAWLYRVAVNQVRSRWRHLLIARRVHARLASEPAPESRESGYEQRRALLDAMRRLPFAQREALALFYLADLPIDEVAARTEVPVGTVKARLSRGRTALAQLIGPEISGLPDPVGTAPRSHAAGGEKNV